MAGGEDGCGYLVPGSAASRFSDRWLPSRACDIDHEHSDNNLANQPPFTWSVSGVGSVNSSGLYTAPSAGNDSSVTISASSGGKTGTAAVAVKANDSDVYVQATDGNLPVNEVKVFTASGVWKETLPINGPFPKGLIFRGRENIYLDDGTYLDASRPFLARRSARGYVIQTYISAHEPPWTGMVLDPNGTSFWACDESCYVYHFDIYTGAEYLEFWAANWLGEMGVLAVPRLLELTVADHNNPANKITAIDLAIQDLYVPEDQTTHTADIDINTLFHASEYAKRIHLSVECTYDGEVIRDDTRTSLNLKLVDHTGQGRNYAITAWLDKNGNNKFDFDDDEEMLLVIVHLVTPWRAEGEWQTGHASFVRANADGASLADLAKAITKIPADATLIGGNLKITRGMLVDVTPLIKELDRQLHDNIVTATSRTKSAHWPEEGEEYRVGKNAFGKNLTEAGVRAFFNGTSGNPPIECNGMAKIVMAYGLILTLNSGEFDSLGYLSSTIPARPFDYRPSKRPTSARVGEAVYIFNHDSYLSKFGMGGMWHGENTIKIDADSYWGWRGWDCRDSFAGWQNTLWNKLKTRLSWHEKLVYAFQMPDKVTVNFFDTWRIGLDVFNSRTRQR